MQKFFQTIIYFLSITALAVLVGCAGMSAEDKSTAVGAGVGAVGGAVLTGGSPVGTVGGAAIGGYIGHESEKSKK
jgi:osmotically inducible lipoprotein OsmB